MKFRYSHFVALSAVLTFGACKGGANNASTSDATPAAPAAPASVDPATVGTITGVIKFDGTAPKPQKISMTADAYCNTAHPAGVMSEDVVVNPNNTLKWVYIHVKSGLGDKKFPVPSTPVVLDQHGCLYSPHVVALQVGQPLMVRNDDSVLHNVDVRPATNQGFNIGQPVQGMQTPKTFAQVELAIPVKCDVHPWMHGWIFVQDNPFFAVTGDDGSFALKDLPPGDYEIEAWQEKYGSKTMKVTVGAKETKTVDFTFQGA